MTTGRHIFGTTFCLSIFIGCSPTCLTSQPAYLMTIVQSRLARPSFISLAQCADTYALREFRRHRRTCPAQKRVEKGVGVGGPKSATRRKAGTIRCRSQAKSSEQPNPLSIDPSALDMRGNLFSPLPNSIRGARDDRCWWEAFQGVGEGVNTVTRARKEGKALINSCVYCYSCVSCTAQLSVRDTKAPNEGSSRSDLPLLRASVFFFSEDEL